MNGLLVSVVISLSVSLIAAETTEISPWLARRIVRWAAYRWASKPQRAAEYAEEWLALVDDCPGKLFKLFTALSLARGAAMRSLPRSLKSACRREVMGLRLLLRLLVEDRRFRYGYLATAIPGSFGMGTAFAGITSSFSTSTLLGAIKVWLVLVGFALFVGCTALSIWIFNKRLKEFRRRRGV